MNFPRLLKEVQFVFLQSEVIYVRGALTYANDGQVIVQRRVHVDVGDVVFV